MAGTGPYVPTLTPLIQAGSPEKKPRLSQNKLLTYFTDPIMHIDYDRIRYPKYPDAIYD
jgi:hypothetical protein